MRWTAGDAGVLELPSGRLVRGRRFSLPAATEPEFGLCLRWSRPTTSWPSRWVRWPDFGVPLDEADARAAIEEAWRRCGEERVEVACGGGRGRTGTALAAMAMLDGLGLDEAIDWVRRGYDRRAVETPWQRAWLGR